MKAILPERLETPMKEAFFAGSPAGFFVEVGANDPELGSQTWHLEQRGWRGVLIEPQSDLADKLRQRRRAKVYAAVCSSPANAGKTMTLTLAGKHSSLNPGVVDPALPRTAGAEVPAMTLDEILTDAGAPSPIDFVSIDVENHELEVLDGFDLERWRPRLILIEDHAIDLALHRRLTGRGYKWVRRTGLNGWYVPRDTPLGVSAFGRMQFYRKYYLSTPFRQLRQIKRRLVHRAGTRRPMQNQA
jgi:FkbM family methyltransferase